MALAWHDEQLPYTMARNTTLLAAMSSSSIASQQLATRSWTWAAELSDAEAVECATWISLLAASLRLTAVGRLHGVRKSSDTQLRQSAAVGAAKP